MINRLVLLLVFTFSVSTVFAADFAGSGIFDGVMEKLRVFASDTIQINRHLKETGEKIKQTDFQGIFRRGYEKFNEFLEEHKPRQQKSKQWENNRRALKHFLKELGEKKFGEEGKTLNQHAGDFIVKMRPDLQDTDFSGNPAGTIYYYLALDPRGFVENVRIIRGPLGAPMTIRQAYEYYTQTDPEKAAKILILLETLQKLGAPTTDEDQLDIILKAVKTNLELINDSSTDKEEKPAQR